MGHNLFSCQLEKDVNGENQVPCKSRPPSLSTPHQARTMSYVLRDTSLVVGERVTCGLRISDSPTSDNLTPQKTINQDAADVGADGAELSCPGSSVVAILRSEA
jgi:hypothetical protein